ncbi:hypothetical protein [Actinomadura rudentiformis]|uniref:Uncharacterized protein n=1 Tax=Actinomadura rudentiformis TaxID=359158 RepID=A0A6H9YTC3_9ACTN|nr:hypothetical protein [Actinomadura rudentiformis]KAB2350131.1 hypothetical protein F8566_10025 [Actinomadura rudentiformis]
MSDGPCRLPPLPGAAVNLDALLADLTAAPCCRSVSTNVHADVVRLDLLGVDLLIAGSRRS